MTTNKDVSFTDKLVGVLGKIGGLISNQKHLAAIRDAFVTFVPLVIVGAFAVLLNSVFVDNNGLIADLTNSTDSVAWESISFYLSPVLDGINMATIGTFSVYISFLIGYFLSGSYGNNKTFGGLISLAAFFLMLPIQTSSQFGGDGLEYLGTSGLLVAIAVSLIAPMVYNFFASKEKLKISMPDSVPPAVAKSFNDLFPIVFTLIVLGLIQPIWGAIAFSSGIGGYINTAGERVITENYFLISAINTAIAQPLLGASNSLAFVLVFEFLFALLFFFGVHGANVLAPIYVPLWASASLYNINTYAQYGTQAYDASFLVSQGLDPLYTWTMSTHTISAVGGVGATLGLLMLMTFMSKNKVQKKVTSVATPPGLFNINEPVIFGLPVLLTPIWFIPFILGLPITATTTYLFIETGAMNPTVFQVPWSTPIFIAGFISTLDPMSILLGFVHIAELVLLYLPFVILSLKASKNEFGPEMFDERTIAGDIWYNLTDKEHKAAKKEAKKERKDKKKEMKSNKENNNNNDSSFNNILKYNENKISKIASISSMFVIAGVIATSIGMIVGGYTSDTFREYDFYTTYTNQTGVEFGEENRLDPNLNGSGATNTITIVDPINGSQEFPPLEITLSSAWNLADNVEQNNIISEFTNQLDNGETQLTYSFEYTLATESNTIQGKVDMFWNYDENLIEYSPNGGIIAGFSVLLAIYVTAGTLIFKKNYKYTTADTKEIPGGLTASNLIFGGVIPGIVMILDKKNQKNKLVDNNIKNNDDTNKDETINNIEIEKEESSEKKVENKVEEKIEKKPIKKPTKKNIKKIEDK